MDKTTLKKKLLDAVAARADDIIAVGDWIWNNPEVGFKEFKTADYTANVFRNLGLDAEENICITGARAHAANIAMSAIDAQRETFKDSDAVRVHYFITKGGDAVNIVPSIVRMEMMIRAATVDAIKDASMKVDRALKGGALALGAEVIIENIPGYLPSPVNTSPSLWRIMRDNALEIFNESDLVIGTESPSPIRVPHGAVSDINDIANLMPKASFGVGGAIGVGHSRNYIIEDKYNAFVNPTKLYVGMIFDLLWDGAKLATKIINEYEPQVEKVSYMDYWKDILEN